MLTTRTTASTVRHCQAVCKPGEKDISYCFNLKQLRVNIVLLFTLFVYLPTGTSTCASCQSKMSNKY